MPPARLSPDTIMKVVNKGILKYVKNLNREEYRYVENSLNFAPRRLQGSFGEVVTYSCEFYVGNTVERERCYFVTKVESLEGNGQRIMNNEKRIQEVLLANVGKYRGKDAPIAIPLRSYTYRTPTVNARATIYKFCKYESFGQQYCDLAQFMKNTPNTAEDLSLARIRDMMKMILQDIQFLHDLGISHGDLKPQNFLVTKGRNGDLCIKLTDFGGCYLSDKDDYAMSRYHYDLSTLSYRCPEMLRNDYYNRYQRDLWAAGLIYYELLNLAHVFIPADGLGIHGVLAVREWILNKLDRDYLFRQNWRVEELGCNADMSLARKWYTHESIVAKALARDPRDRFQDCAAMLKAVIEYKRPTPCAKFRGSIIDWFRAAFPPAEYNNTAALRLEEQTVDDGAGDRDRKAVAEMREETKYAGVVYVANYDFIGDAAQNELTYWQHDILYDCTQRSNGMLYGKNYFSGKEGAFTADYFTRWHTRSG